MLQMLGAVANESLLCKKQRVACLDYGAGVVAEIVERKSRISSSGKSRNINWAKSIKVLNLAPNMTHAY